MVSQNYLADSPDQKAMRQDGGMTEHPGSPRRRRRRARRAGPSEPAPAGQPGSNPATAAEDHGSEAAPATGRPGRPDRAAAASGGQAKPRRRAAGRAADGVPSKDTDRGWRELLGNAPSQVGVSGAMRARDVARPGPDELAAAERDLAIVRRQWRPPEELGQPPQPAGR